MRNLDLKIINCTILTLGTQILHCNLLSLTKNGGLATSSIVMVWFGKTREVAIIIVTSTIFIKLLLYSARKLKFDSISIFEEQGFVGSRSVVRNELF